MKHLQKVFFNVFFVLIAFISGAFITSLVITDNTGLAGGATVFWGGIMGAFFGLIFGFVINNYIGKPIIKSIISILGFILLLGCFIFFKMHA